MSKQECIIAIHQFFSSREIDDEVRNRMLFTRKVLRELGFKSDIFCEFSSTEISNDVQHRRHLQLEKNDVLLVYFNSDEPNDAWLSEIQTKKILIYQQARALLPAIHKEYLIVNNRYLSSHRSDYVGAIGISSKDTKELMLADYSNVATIPLLVDFEEILEAKCDLEFIQQWQDTYNLLFVGNYSEIEHQFELLQLLQLLKKHTHHRLRLILVGEVLSPAYFLEIKEFISKNELSVEVMLTGDLKNEQLIALYRSADLYISLSEQEGIEKHFLGALVHDIPIIAKGHGSISSIMPLVGVLMPEDCSIKDVAANIFLLMSDAVFRRQIRFQQRKNYERFRSVHIQVELNNFLNTIGVFAPHKNNLIQNNEMQIQLEGPFDSSYSLAIVNRELARAIHNKKYKISLRSREGFGDFEMSPNFLIHNPELKNLVDNFRDKKRNPEIVLRNCYPPSLDDMQGCIRAINSYGWEETGFPFEYVKEFNLKLDLVTVVSQFVKKALIDNGVHIPIAVVGNGVDHLLNIQAEELPHNLAQKWKSFRFLHISSCFPRKGVDALLEAYGKAFRIDDDVSLVIKTFPNPHNEVQSQVEKWQKKDARFPHVHIINEDYSDGLLKSLYEICDAVVAPSRGEGFGLPIAEAMVFNLPVITTGWSGQLDFVDNDSAWLCDYQFAKSTSHFKGLHSVWANPDVQHLAKLMNEVYLSSKDEIKKRTTLARFKILNHFKWSDVAERTLAALEVVKDQKILKQEPNIAWVSTWNARCGVASYSAFLSSQIPARRLTMLSNYVAERTFKDEANVRRCWNADMSEELDYVFESILEFNCKVVIVQYNFGFYSLNTLATLIRKLKKHNIGIHVFFHSTADVVIEEIEVSLSDIVDDLQIVDRLYVHSVDDLNRLKNFGLQHNVVYFPQGLMPTLAQSNAVERKNRAEKVIASYGFLLPHKGIQALIKAFIILSKIDSSLRLILVNSLYPVSLSEHELYQCKLLIENANLFHRIDIYSDYLTDETSQLLLQKADIIVYPYQETQESSSAAVRMGLAAGKPIAVTPLSIFDDVKDVVHYLPGTSPEEIAEGLMTLLKDEHLLHEKDVNAKAWVEARQWSELSIRLLNTIDGLANEIM